MATELLEIDSKGMCILCLKVPPETESDGTDPGSSSSSSKPSVSLKMLLRYLKVDIATLANFKCDILHESGDSPTDNNFNIAVSLCDECNLEVNNFWELYKLWEATRLQLDQTVQKISHLINAGDKESRRTAEFRRRFGTGKLGDKFNASVVENLRKKTRDKCQQKITKESTPRVELRREEMENQKIAKESTPRVELIREEMENLALPPAPTEAPPPPPPTNSANVVEDSTEKMDLDNMTFEEMVVKVEPFPDYEPYDNDDVVPNRPNVSDVDFEDESELRASNPVIDATDLMADVGGSMNHSIFGTRLDLEGASNPGRRTNKMIRPLKAASLKKHLRHHDHQRKSHPNATLSCDFCQAVFSSQASRIHHTILGHPVHLFKDLLPSWTTDTDFLLALGSLTENCQGSEGSFQCPSCPKAYDKWPKTRYHLARKHLDIIALQIEQDIGLGEDKLRVRFQSDEERQNFKKKVNALVRSLSSVPSPAKASRKTYNCGFCGSNYNTFWERENHLLLKHAVEELATKLPRGTTPNEFDQVVTDLIEEGNKRELWHCPQCSKLMAKKETTEDDWRLHLLKEHVNVLRDTLRKGRRVEVVQEKF